MWSVLARFRHDAERLESALNIRRERGEVRRRLHPTPNDARVVLIREKSHSAKVQADRFDGMERGERILNRAQLVAINVADKFECNVQVFGFHPARPSGFRRERGDEVSEGAADGFWQIECNKKTHGLCPAASGEEKIASHGIERCLRGVHTDAFAVAARELEAAFARAALIGNTDVYEAYGLFRRAAARPRYSRDAHADCGACYFANAIGKRERYFRAHCALRFNQLRRNANESRLQFIAVADHTAEEITRTSTEIREPLGEHSAGAALCDGNCGAIFSENARDDFFHRFA